ncbi:MULTISPECIES: sulfur carrier protein ThiS [Syntrophotalea]|jgi:sulfur carrier protein|uniref:Thiamine biosynthesis protein ThiS n=1 Tax=Syntrophotalea acetylenica TaxID=29542 RepID=A0A1L3GGD8_SYNAC|nr:sulfur carrier protein ThiS [Syntrophotalea acetylenica]APG24929.1 thiamine biosynthesis protein ThiS [Syntrophotalea acetylenica]APG42993.1 thiamine biosynthesis protein ThiS [Syntrophotalea acetylenica]MDY0263488.1 sulfur carrier protein ThiS [Syntrophotalea acetylenica]
MSQLTVNGKPLVLALPATVLDLLSHLDFDPAKVAVELNGAIVPRDAFEDTDLTRGDQLEIVQFVGGG